LNNIPVFYIVFIAHDMEVDHGSGSSKGGAGLDRGRARAITDMSRRRKTAQALALRSRIILACSGGAENKAVAAHRAVAKQTVSKWRGRFLQFRLDGLVDAPRSGTPRTIGTSNYR
jgi:hypothetical protein